GPARPDFAVSGLVMDKPDLKSVPASAPDPFKDTAVPISDVYGWSWRFTNYDLGCGNDFIRDPSAVATTTSANFVLAWMNTLGSSLESLENMARTATFDWLETVVTSIAGTLMTRVLTVWLPLAAVLLAIVVAFTARNAGYAETMRRLGILVGAIVLAVVTLVLPKQAIALANSAVDTATGAAQAGFSSTASDLITREALYKTWLIGNFGSADSPIAQEYGPRLMSALTYTWSDVKRMESDPDAKAKIDKAKATEFKWVADEVKKKDPVAYQSLTGKTDTRTATATLGVVWIVLMGLFVALSSFVIVMARLIMLGLILYGMVASVIGVLKFAVLQRVWDLFTAAVLNLVKFTLAAGMMTLILSAISTAPIAGGWRILLALAATVFAIAVTRPIKSFKAMAGMDPNRSVFASMMKRAIGTAVGLAAGSKFVGLPGKDEKKDETPAAAGSEEQQPVEPSHPPLPAPAPLQALPVGARWEQVDQSQQTTAWGGYTAVGGHTRSHSLDLRVAPAPPRPTLPAALDQRPRELPAGTTTVPVPSPTAAAGADTSRRAVEADRPRLLDAGNTATSSTTEPIPLVSSGSSVQPPVVGDPPPPTGPAAPAPVVYPTGIIIQPDAGLYRSSGAAAEYHRFTEPQVDAQGQETWEPLYRAEKTRT
ncbi:MAG: hypothetical protein L0H26_05780, partial [Microlunatus sp.]|nr:hypothetical protein [Microlunatus sp.]